MDLMIKKLARKIPKIMETEGSGADEIVVWVHYFKNNQHWYVIEYDGADTFFGYAVCSVVGEFGHYYLSELAKQGFKRDLSWNCCKLIDIMKYRG